MRLKTPAWISHRDTLWLVVWVGGLLCLGIWDALFLNAPAFEALQIASVNTLMVGLFVVALSFLMGWVIGVSLHILDEARNRVPYHVLQFILNLIRSVPQIIGVLIGYVILTLFIQDEVLRRQFSQLFWMSIIISIFVFLEIVDLIRERIAYYRKLDFYDAMLCCGISESRIVNVDILYRNSRAHLLHKLIAIFGMTMFLLCSVDFIVSVGLSTDVSLSNFPATLGGLLAKGDSKQDILAIGTVLTDITKFPGLFFEHLQGISTAWIIVFTLLCIYNISNGFVKRHRL